MNVSKRWAAVLGGLAVAVGGYAVDASAPPPPADLVTLRIGTDNGPGRPDADQIDEFARQVDELSSGQVRIEPVWHAAGEQPLDDWDQQVARLVVAGDLDLAVVPARAWDTEGVTTMRAVHAPFLVTSDELVNRVVVDDVADEMLAGLDALGVTGLAVVPESLRHVFAFDEPIVTAADFAGITVRVPTSSTSYALFEALGATPDDFAGNDFESLIEDGSLAAIDSSFAVGGGGETIVAGNITPYPKVNTIVANSATLSTLSEEQQGFVHDAAIATRDWAIANYLGEAEHARIFCRNGGTVVTADGADVEALRQAAEPVYAELEQDQGTATMITRIGELAAEVGSADPVEACTPASVSTGAEPDGSEPESSPAVDAEFPDGVYVAEMTVESLMDADVNRPDAVNHGGTWTLTFDAGELTVHDVNATTGLVTELHGVYCVEDGRVFLGLLGEPPECGDFWNAEWLLEGDQLRFVDVQSDSGFQLLIATQFDGRPFTKVD